MINIICHQPNFLWTKGSSFPSKNAPFLGFLGRIMRSRFKFEASPGGTDGRKGWSVADCDHVTLVCQKVPPLELGFPALLWVVYLSISTRFLWETAQNKKTSLSIQKNEKHNKSKERETEVNMAFEGGQFWVN